MFWVQFLTILIYTTPHMGIITDNSSITMVIPIITGRRA